MRRPATLFPIALALGAMVLAPGAGAREEGPTEIERCQTISQPGSYRLVNNLTATGDCLLINADFVTIDLAGFAMIGQNSGTAIRIGPTPQSARRGIAVRNGTISDFSQGVSIGAVGGTQGAIVEGLRIFGAGTGIVARGIVRGNTVADCAGVSLGILALFASATTGNAVTGCDNGIDAVGGIVSGNTVDTTGTGINVERGTVIGNSVTSNGVGISATCPSNLTDNLTLGNPSLVLNGTDCHNEDNVAP